MKILPRILVVVLIQTLILLAIIGFRQWTLKTGQEILLETVPIDPRSLFSGDYINLAYQISEITVNPEIIPYLKRNQTVYITLAPSENVEDPYWKFKAFSVHRPKPEPPNIIVKGRVVGADQDKLYILYGIENYFVQENEGKKIEQPKTNDKLTVRVMVDRFGNAAIAGLLLNGQEVYKESLI